MKILKIISIISFLLICIIDPKEFPIFIMILISLVEFFNSFSYTNLGISWEGLFAIPVIGSLVVFSQCKKYKNRYLLLFCFIALLFSGIIFTGILNPNNHYRPLPIGFIIPTTIFIISSVWLIILNFKKPDIKEEE